MVSGLFGLLVGSFLNVVIYRVPLGMSVVRPPSHCPSCDTELKNIDNVPLVSWIALRGRCRYCQAPISPRYPMVELITGLLFAAMAWALGSLDPLVSLLVLVATTTAAVAISLDGLAIPWSICGVVGAGAASLVLVALATGQPGRIGWALLGGACSAAAGGLISWRRPNWPSVTVVASLGWSASWLWPAAGPILAGWALATGIVVSLRRGARTEATAGRPPAARAPETADSVHHPPAAVTPNLHLLVVAAGALGLVLAAAAVGGPY